METNQNYPSTAENDLFEENEFQQFDLATNNQRFVNFLIDAILLRFALAYATSYALMNLLLSVNPELAYEWFAPDADKMTTILVSYGLGVFNYLFYYTLCEKAFRGYTLGKLISGTRAIREDGGELTFKDAFLRSLSRVVPFEAFSIWFGSGLWHDTWTNTRVIQSR